MRQFRLIVEAGGLIAHGPDLPDLSRRAAAYVDRILGVRPTDLPVEQPRCSSDIDLKTAKALGLTIPPITAAAGRSDH
jgi:putative ABC transport system substrate-binding protein